MEIPIEPAGRARAIALVVLREEAHACGVGSPWPPLSLFVCAGPHVLRGPQAAGPSAGVRSGEIGGVSEKARELEGEFEKLRPQPKALILRATTRARDAAYRPRV